MPDDKPLIGPATEQVLLVYRLEIAEKTISELDDKLRHLERLEEAREKRYFLWGLRTLGGITFAAFTVIWAYRGVIFK